MRAVCSYSPCSCSSNPFDDCQIVGPKKEHAHLDDGHLVFHEHSSCYGEQLYCLRDMTKNLGNFDEVVDEVDGGC